MKSDGSARAPLQLKHPPTPKPARATREREVACTNLFTAARALDERVECELYPERALPTKLTARNIDACMRVAEWLRKKGEALHAQLEREKRPGKTDEPAGD